MIDNRQSEKGVTLIETLVALSVLAMAALSALLLIGQNTRFATSSLEKTYAAIAADNAMIEIFATGQRLDTGAQTQSYEFQGYEWSLQRTVSETGVEDLVRIDIQIRNAQNGQVIISLTSLRTAS